MRLQGNSIATGIFAREPQQQLARVRLPRPSAAPLQFTAPALKGSDYRRAVPAALEGAEFRSVCRPKSAKQRYLLSFPVRAAARGDGRPPR